MTTRGAQALVVFAGPTDLEADCERRDGVSPSLQALFDRGLEIDDEARAILRETSPLNHLTAQSPPTLLDPRHGRRKRAVFAIGELSGTLEGARRAVRTNHDSRRRTPYAELGIARARLPAEDGSTGSASVELRQRTSRRTRSRTYRCRVR